jgi:photosystem II stability/assembly factor-like uncharacterized protein
MNESAIRERLRKAVGETSYPPGLTSRVEARLRQPLQERRQSAPFTMALVAALLAVAIVATLVFTARALHSSKPPTVPGGTRAVPTSQPGTGFPTSQPGTGYVRPTFSFPVKMIDGNTGWATGALRTTDGGAHWEDVSPPSLPNRQGDAAEFYLDSNHAWQGQTFAGHVVIFRTADGGRTWQQGAAVPVKGTDPTGIRSITSGLYFIDDQRGWLQTGNSIGMGSFQYGPSPDPAAQGLYRTVDGGLRWTLESTGPGAAATGCFFGGDMTFISTTRGWILPNCPPGLGHSRLELLATSNGGVTWSVQELATDSRCPCGLDGAPVFFDQQYGFAQGHESDGTPLLLATTDGGSSWSARTVPGEGSKGGILRLSFADASAGWAIVEVAKKGPIYPSPTCSSGYAYSPSECYPPPQMYHTVDGGRTWALMQTDLFSPDGEAGSLLFVDAHNGFALRDLFSTQNLQSVLLRTTDGGTTWHLVAAAIVGH